MYGVVSLGKDDLIWDKLVATSYPHNTAYYNSLAATNNTDIITRLLEGRLKLLGLV